MRRLSVQQEDQWVEHSSPRVFDYTGDAGSARLEADISSGDASVFEQMALILKPPYFLLYVLHTPRGEGAPGRYQSPPISDNELSGFLSTFACFLASDARFDIWVHSPSEGATVVWDRHDRLFAYGPVERYASKLKELAFGSGTIAPLGEHMHHYRPDFDADATEVLNTFQWRYSPLKQEDEQRPG